MMPATLDHPFRRVFEAVLFASPRGQKQGQLRTPQLDTRLKLCSRFLGRPWRRPCRVDIAAHERLIFPAPLPTYNRDQDPWKKHLCWIPWNEAVSPDYVDDERYAEGIPCMWLPSPKAWGPRWGVSSPRSGRLRFATLCVRQSSLRDEFRRCHWLGARGGGSADSGQTRGAVGRVRADANQIEAMPSHAACHSGPNGAVER